MIDTCSKDDAALIMRVIPSINNFCTVHIPSETDIVNLIITLNDTLKKEPFTHIILNCNLAIANMMKFYGLHWAYLIN
jgi:hypothetical protein